MDVKQSYNDTRFARFINQYSPIYDKPFTHYSLNENYVLCPHLCKTLLDDQKHNREHHLKTDKAFKTYLLEAKKASILRS